MTPLRIRRSLLSAVAALALTAAPAVAQQNVPDIGGRVYGLVGGGFGDGTFVATGAGAGLRLTPYLGLDLELTHLSGRGDAETATPSFDAVSAFSGISFAGAAFEDYPPFGAGNFRFPSVRIEDEGRDVTTFVTRFTVEFPIANGRLFPYLTGGGGVGRVTERFSVVIDPIPWIPLHRIPSTGQTGGSVDADGLVRFFDSLTPPVASEYSELGLSLLLGGGVDVRLWRGLGVGVDVRWLRILLNYDDFDTAQVTSRVSYRF